MAPNGVAHIRSRSCAAHPAKAEGVQCGGEVQRILRGDRRSGQPVRTRGSGIRVGPKVVLQNQIDNNYGRITVSEELGSIDLMAANDSRWSSKLLVLQTGVSAGFKDVHRWRIRVPRFQSVSTDEATLIKMVEKFVADNKNPHFPRGKTLDVWIVSEVITAPSLSFYAFDQTGANIGLSLPPLAPLPVDLQVGLEGEVGAQGFFFRRGPELGGTVQPLPFAFRGWKYKLHNGWLKKPKRARYQADSFDAFPPNTAPIRNAIPATPSADPDMADFVGGDEWVTTIVEAEDPAQL